MAINPATLIPAVIKAKNVATEDYVDTSTDGMLTDSNFNTNITTIDGGKITTNSVDANRIKVNTIWTNGSVQSSDFTTVGGAGFRLKANIETPSYTNPTIYGAYIRGGTIEGVTMNASDIKVFSNYVGKTGNISYSLSSGYLHGPNYGSGHLASRVCQFTSRITIIGSWGYASGFGQLVTATLDYAINGGPWVTLATGYAGAGTGGLPLGATVLLSDLTSLAACTITFRITGNYAYGNHFWVATLNNQ
jgi:hypothetical protein